MTEQQTKPDPYLDALTQQQQRRAQFVRGAGLLLVVEGLGALLYGLLIVFSHTDHQLVKFVALGLGAASILAGVVIMLRERRGEGGTGFDDVVNNLSPRILGGKKPEQLEQHRRRGKRGHRGR